MPRRNLPWCQRRWSQLHLLRPRRASMLPAFIPESTWSIFPLTRPVVPGFSVPPCNVVKSLHHPTEVNSKAAEAKKRHSSFTAQMFSHATLLSSMMPKSDHQNTWQLQLQELEGCLWCKKKECFKVTSINVNWIEVKEDMLELSVCIQNSWR